MSERQRQMEERASVVVELQGSTTTRERIGVVEERTGAVQVEAETRSSALISGELIAKVMARLGRRVIANHFLGGAHGGVPVSHFKQHGKHDVAVGILFHCVLVRFAWHAAASQVLGLVLHPAEVHREWHQVDIPASALSCQNSIPPADAHLFQLVSSQQLCHLFIRPAMDNASSCAVAVGGVGGSYQESRWRTGDLAKLGDEDGRSARLGNIATSATHNPSS